MICFLCGVASWVNSLPFSDETKAAAVLVGKHGASIVRDEKMFVVEIDLSDSNLGDDDAKYLAALPSLTTLSLARTGLTNAGMKELGGLKKLVSLDLDTVGVSDSGVKYLGECKSLRPLNMRGTTVTDAGLKTISSLKRIVF